MSYFCNVCDKTIITKSRKKHNQTKSHYFMKNYVTNIYNYNDNVWGHVENILHENFISHDIKFNDFKIYVSCKMNNDVEIKVYKNECDLRVVLPLFLGWDLGTLNVHVAVKMICNKVCESLSSKYDIICVPNMKIRILTIKFISRYNNMTYRYQLEQPRPIIESKMVKHIKNMSEEEQDNYNFLVCKHKNC